MKTIKTRIYHVTMNFVTPIEIFGMTFTNYQVDLRSEVDVAKFLEGRPVYDNLDNEECRGWKGPDYLAGITSEEIEETVLEESDWEKLADEFGYDDADEFLEDEPEITAADLMDYVCTYIY